MEERLRYLFGRYLHNHCSRQELEEFFAYLREAEHDEDIRLCIKRLYQELGGQGHAGTYVNEEGRLVLENPEWMPEEAAPAPRTNWPARLTVAAFVVMMAGTIWFIREKAGSNPPPAQLASHTRKFTDRSELKYLLLEDSTRVWLNAASSLEFPDRFQQNRREVFLSGEAFFEVKHAEKIPFIIHTGQVSTTVLGTAFNIKAYPGEKNITVSVSRGTVKVSRSDGYTATLTGGRQIKLEAQRKDVVEKKIAMGDVAAWQRGFIVYDDEPMADILADMERIYNVQVQVEDPAHRGVRISTSFKKEIGIEQALQVLCRLTDTRLKSVNGNYIIQ